MSLTTHTTPTDDDALQTSSDIDRRLGHLERRIVTLTAEADQAVTLEHLRTIEAALADAQQRAKVLGRRRQTVVHDEHIQVMKRIEARGRRAELAGHQLVIDLTPLLEEFLELHAKLTEVRRAAVAAGADVSALPWADAPDPQRAQWPALQQLDAAEYVIRNEWLPNLLPSARQQLATGGA